MNNPDKKSPEQASDPSSLDTDSPVQAGKQAIEAAKKTSGLPKDAAEEENKKDAEKWRNEG